MRLWRLVTGDCNAALGHCHDLYSAALLYAYALHHHFPSPDPKRRCEITIISFSRSICHEGLAALIGVTRKPYPICLSCHSHPIRPCGAPSPRGEGCDTRISSSKKGGEAATSPLNLEPNESKVKRSCEEMRIHFFTAPFYCMIFNSSSK